MKIISQRPAYFIYPLILCLFTLFSLPAWSQNLLPESLNRAQAQVGFTRSAPQDTPVRLPTDTYPLGPGDQVVISLWNDRLNLTYDLAVNPQGEIQIPRVGIFQVSGQKLADLENAIQQRTLKLQKDRVQVSVFLKQIRRVQVLVTGYVNRPGYYQVYWGSPLLEALRFAGGVKDNGSVRQIRLQQSKQSSPQSIDLFAFHFGGNPQANPLLYGGEQIHVPAIEQKIAVLGEVQQPGLYEVLPGENAEQILIWAGGSKATADPEQTQIWVDGLNQKSQAKILPALNQTRLQNGDLLYLPPRKLTGINASILIQGLIRQSGPQAWQEGMHLLDAIEQAGGSLTNANLADIKISRQSDATRQSLTVNLEAYLKGENPDGNPELLPNDLIQIPEQFFNIRNITELTTLILSTLGIVSVVLNLSRPNP